MNCYEHTLITKQDLQEKQTKSLISKYEEIINKNAGKVLKIEEWGIKNFSHKIRNNKMISTRNIKLYVFIGQLRTLKFNNINII